MNSQQILCYVNNWLIDISSGSLIHRETGEQKRLGEYQLKLLEILIDNAGKVLTREELTELVWHKRVIGNNSLPNAIHALRLALEDSGKHQKIIKTIPKRGYLLEKAFCSFESVPTPAETVNASQYSPVLLDNPVQAKDILPVEAAFSPQKTSKKWSLYLLVLVCLLSLSFSIYTFLSSVKNVDNERINVQQRKYLPLKHIDMFQVTNSLNRKEKIDNPDKLEQRLLSTLQKLDTRLAERQSHLSIYYQPSDTVLNYVFVIESPCQKQELSMNIYHWRINNEQLNALILRETERKIDETTSCLK